MRIAVLSDIHANLTALEAVADDIRQLGADLVVLGGDLVGTGGRPAEVIDLIRDRGWPGILGNTDEMLWNHAKVMEYFSPPALEPWRQMTGRSIAATLGAIGETRVDWLRALPMEYLSQGLAVVHATRSDCWRAPGLNASDEALITAYGSFGTEHVVYGHIHQPFVRRVGGFTVINAGSVGMPHDGDPRASYTVLDEGHAAIRRVEYDVEREIAALRQLDWPDCEWAAAALRSGTPSPPV